MLGAMTAPKQNRRRQPSLAVTVAAPLVLTVGLLLTAALAQNGSILFYATTFGAAAVLFGTWALFGDHARSFPRDRLWPGLARGVVVGLGLLAVFVLGAFVLRQIPVLAMPVQDLMSNVVLGGATVTLATTLLNGVGEELFFRNTVVSRLRARGLAEKWVFGLAMGAYLVATCALLVPLLPLAGLVLGVVAHVEAERTGALYSPVVLHLVWSTGLFFVLPVVL